MDGNQTTSKDQNRVKVPKHGWETDHKQRPKQSQGPKLGWEPDQNIDKVQSIDGNKTRTTESQGP